MSTQRRTVLFLYNHDAAHQAAHIAGVMGALAESRPELDVLAATGSPAIETQVRSLITPAQGGAIRWVDLSLPGWMNGALALLNKLAPVIRLARLRRHIALFETADLIVSPERTCLRVRRKLRRGMGNTAPRFVFIPHGAGDRSVSYHPELAQFDYFLLSGQKVADEMVAHGLAAPDQCRLIGYAKFDAVGNGGPRKLFDNDLPTIVYNPHFDPHLSSWYDTGPAFLRWVATQQGRFNCVFAPHVMLFRKKLHISPEYKTARRRPEIPAEALAADNILIDTNSPALFDMTYTNSGDIYVGDVSSQVYEFLRRPRPVVFIDAAGQGADAYQFWQNGPVVTSASDLAEQLADWRETGARFREAQERLFAYTMDIRPERSAAQRGADALAELVDAKS
ncbi:hypothetical protein HME9302_01266 [Alteripontixanthobacter maritimus]|uniref:Glycerophosphotransferase n=1 Tax=Alteripontixanthobacter maritimus TaxID=2161824 RepID=A0A369Q9Z4_9SPHN|nr:hypothetical protein [Alteripontixanthobacter maritimus]RDC60067.1 hypothetical protein HME9302_01266 [Alteripontixanthobacter maritimus]